MKYTQNFILVSLLAAFFLCGCVNDDNSPHDTITIGRASSGQFRAVLNGNEDMRSIELNLSYDHFDSSLLAYAKFDNGCYLTFGVQIPLKQDKEVHVSPSSGYFWDPRKMNGTYWKMGNDDITFRITKLDTIAKLISGVFNYSIHFGDSHWDARLSQGSFTDVPYLVQPSSTFSYFYSITGFDWADSTSSIEPFNNYLSHPSEVINLQLLEFSSDGPQESVVFLSLPVNRITLGEHELKSSAYSITCRTWSDTTFNYYPSDSVQSGTLTISSFDAANRHISGSFNFKTKDDKGTGSISVSGSFRDINWYDNIEK